MNEATDYQELVRLGHVTCFFSTAELRDYWRSHIRAQARADRLTIRTTGLDSKITFLAHAWLPDHTPTEEQLQDEWEAARAALGGSA